LILPLVLICYIGARHENGKLMQPIDFQNNIIYQFRNLPDREQELIRAFFGNKKNGFYVDVGANEPIIESQTFHLEQMGWQGLLIEPLPQYIRILKAQRTGTVVGYACSSPENHGKVLDIIVAGGHSTLNTAPIAINSNSSEIAQVSCKTLDSILEDHQVPAGFEFISIDIEGHEMEMFKGFSLDRWRPQLVLLEDHVINHEKHRLMTRFGYQVILRTGLNSWYVPKSCTYKFSLAAQFEFVRKYWLGLLLRKIRYMR
jgi:FkbM family methyltransferase